MPVSFACPQCRVVIKTANAIPAGKKVKCPKCSNIFAAPGRNGSSAVQSAPISQVETGSVFDLSNVEPSKRRRKRGSGLGNLIVASFLILLLVGAGGGYFLWVKFGPKPDSSLANDSKISAKDSSTEVKPTAPEENTANAGSGNEQALALAPPDSNLLVGFQFGEALKNPAFKPLFDQILQKGDVGKLAVDCKKETGLELAELFDQGVVAVTMTLAGPSSQTIIVRSNAPFDPKKVGAFLAGAAARKDKASGKFYYPQLKTEPDVKVVYMPSNRVIVLSDLTPERFAPIFKADGVKPLPRADLLACTAKVNQNPAWMVYMVDPLLKPLLLGVVNPLLPKLPPNLHNGLRQLADAHSAALTLNTEAEQVRLGVTLEFANKAAADLVAPAVGGVWNGFKTNSSPQILGGLKPFPSYFQGLVKDVIANGQVAATENRVEAVVRLSFPAFQGLVGEVASEGDAEVMVCFAEVQALALKPPPEKEPPFQITAEEKVIFDQVNNFRTQQQKLPPLKMNPVLFKVARAHAKLMAEKSAADDEIDGKNNEARLKDVGYVHNGASLNLGNGELGQILGNLWFRALASKTTILDPKYTETGIGVARDPKTNVLFAEQIYAVPKDK